jgi:hypothetical protein
MAKLVEMRREPGIGRLGQVLLQLRRDLLPRRRIERVAQLGECRRRRDKNQSVEGAAGILLVEQIGDLVNESALLGFVGVLARLDGVACRRGALMHSARPVRPEVARSMTKVGRDELAQRVIGIARVASLHEAGGRRPR